MSRSQLVVCRIASRHTGICVLAEQTDTTAGVSAAVSIVSELCLARYVNVFWRDAFLAEKRNDDSLVVLHPLNEKP
jgi:hypothetical protein